MYTLYIRIALCFTRFFSKTFHPNSESRDADETSYEDLVITLAARFCSFCSFTLVDTGAAVTIMREDLLARVRTKETQVKPVTKTTLGANNTFKCYWKC